MLEQVEDATLTALQDGIAAAISEVETAWGDGIDLGSVQTWLQGHHPTVLDSGRDEFPALAVLCSDEESASESDQWGYGDASIVVLINWFVTADTEDSVNTQCKRWGEAIDKVMRDNRNLGTKMDIQSYIPATHLSPVSVDYPASSNEPFYTQMGQKEFTVRVRH